MKTLVTTLIFAGFMGFSAWSQTAMIPGGAPQDILFRGYENVIFVQDNEGLNRKFNVKVEGCDLKIIQPNDGSTSEGRYILRTGTAKNAVLIITDIEGNEMNRYQFKVNNLPETDVQFATENGKFSTEESKLVLKSAYSFLEKSHEIISWTVEKNGTIIGAGKGNEIDRGTMEQLSLLPSGSTFEVKVVLMDNAGISRIRTIACAK